MAHIKSDHPRIKEILSEMIEIIEENGGQLHEDLELVCEEKSLFVKSFEDKRIKGQILNLPHHILMPYDEVEFALTKQQTLKIHSVSFKVSSVQKRLIQLFVELYNETEKVKEHMEFNPWIGFHKDHQLLDKFHEGRPSIESRGLIQRFSDGKSFDDAVLVSFFKTRLLYCRPISQTALLQKMFCPIVDLTNHHIKGASYGSFYNDGKQGRILLNAFQDEDNSELYANYGRLDDLDLLLDYSYWPNTPFVKSIPQKLEIEGFGSFDIKAYRDIADRDELPDDVKDLAFYFPILEINKANKSILMSHLLIPQKQAPLSLTRIILFCLDTLNPSASTAELEKAHEFIVDHVISNNLDYYSDIIDHAISSNAENNVKNQLIACLEAQVSKVKNYVDLLRLIDIKEYILNR